MTLGECLRRADQWRPNTLPEEEKAKVVLDLERALEAEFFPRYEGAPGPGPRRWPEDRAARLLASGPYEELYLHRVVARCELADQEWDAYNAHAALADRLESEFRKAWEREHRRSAAARET